MRRGVSALGVGALVATTVAFTRPVMPPAVVRQHTGYSFTTPAGMLYFHVRPDHAAEFETIVGRIGAALDQSQDPVRRQQAPSWRVYKSAETAPDAVVYLFFFDPAIGGADYDPVKVIGESAPADAQAIYERLKAATIRVERMGLTKLR